MIGISGKIDCHIVEVLGIATLEADATASASTLTDRRLASVEQRWKPRRGNHLVDRVLSPIVRGENAGGRMRVETAGASLNQPLGPRPPIDGSRSVQRIAPARTAADARWPGDAIHAPFGVGHGLVNVNALGSPAGAMDVHELRVTQRRPIVGTPAASGCACWLRLPGRRGARHASL